MVRRKQAELIIAKFDNMLEIGLTESDALSILGIDQKKLNKAESYLIVLAHSLHHTGQLSN